MITICVKRPFICFLDWRVFYQFDRNCALAITCRAINRETSAIMWRSAVCRAVTDAGGPLWLYNLRKVLPSQYAKHITHLRNVRIPVADDVVEWCLEPVPESLLGFPNLQSCGFVMDPDKTLYGYDLASAGDVIVSRAGKFKRQVGLDRQILPFMSTDEHITLPEEILEHEFGIDADCTVQMIMRIDFASFPVRCSVTASGRSIAARLIPCVRIAPWSFTLSGY